MVNVAYVTSLIRSKLLKIRLAHVANSLRIIYNNFHAYPMTNARVTAVSKVENPKFFAVPVVKNTL